MEKIFCHSILKSGNKNSIQNYGPISKLSLISKYLKQLSQKVIIAFFEFN